MKGCFPDPDLILRVTQNELSDSTENRMSSHQPTDKDERYGGPIVGIPLSTLPWQQTRTPSHHIRHLRLDIYLPERYSRKLWEGTFATQLASLVRALDKGQRLRELKVMIASWHDFRTLCDWQATVLLQGFGGLEVKGDVQVRGRGFSREVRREMAEIGLAGEMREGGRAGRRREVPGVCWEGDLDWEWEGGVVV